MTNFWTLLAQLGCWISSRSWTSILAVALGLETTMAAAGMPEPHWATWVKAGVCFLISAAHATKPQARAMENLADIVPTASDTAAASPLRSS